MEAENTIQIEQIRTSRGALINYCYLIVNAVSKSAIVVDPAWDASAIQKQLMKHGVDLAGVLVTHHHVDHMHLAQEFADYYNCKIYISEIEYSFYKLEIHRMFPLHDLTETVIGDICILPIVTPGHTAGSTCFLAGNALFTGDTLFNEGCGLCSGWGADPVEMYASLRKIKKLVPDSVKIYPGHRYYSDLGKTFAEVKKINIYLQIDNQDQFVQFRMRKTRKSMFSFS